MAPGDRVDRARVHRAVDAAERASGLQLCVAFCRPGPEPPEQQARRALVELGAHGVPAALVLVVAEARRVEVRANPESGLTDIDAERAVSAMTADFAAGRFEEGIEAGLAVLVAAGPGGPEGAELPDVLDS